MNTAGVLVAILAIASPALAQNATQRGIWAADLNRSVAPCDDFYEFANGAWRAANPIPAAMPRWSRRWAAGESTKDQLRQILDATAKETNQPKGSADQGGRAALEPPGIPEGVLVPGRRADGAAAGRAM